VAAVVAVAVEVALAVAAGAVAVAAVAAAATARVRSAAAALCPHCLPFRQRTLLAKARPVAARAVAAAPLL